MRERRVLRFYCEHCGKGSGKRAHMKKHERGCIRNRARVCGVCRETGAYQRTIDELIAIASKLNAVTEKGTFYRDSDEKPILDELSNAAEGCPACILAAQFHSGVFFSSFKYKQAHDEFWKNYNDANSEGA